MHKVGIISATYQDDYKIFLTFDDGIKGIANLKSFLFDKDCGVFSRLRNKEQFKKFKLESHTISWEDDLDLAPEFLYDLIF